MDETPCDSEAVLQKLLATYPRLIPMRSSGAESLVGGFWSHVKRVSPSRVRAVPDVNGAAAVFGSGSTEAAYFPVWEGPTVLDGTPSASTSRGYVEASLMSLRRHPPFDDVGLRRQLVERLNAIPGVALPADAVDGRKTFRLGILKDPDAQEALVAR